MFYGKGKEEAAVPDQRVSIPFPGYIHVKLHSK
jgi:hypothetical protein